MVSVGNGEEIRVRLASSRDVRSLNTGLLLSDMMADRQAQITAGITAAITTIIAILRTTAAVEATPVDTVGDTAEGTVGDTTGVMMTTITPEEDALLVRMIDMATIQDWITTPEGKLVFSVTQVEQAIS